MDLAIALLLFYYVGKSKVERGEDLKNGWFGLALLFSVLGAVGVACQKLSRPPKIHNVQGQAVTVIGGADGPTSVYVAMTAGIAAWLEAAMPVLLAAVSVLCFVLRKKFLKKGE